MRKTFRHYVLLNCYWKTKKKRRKPQKIARFTPFLQVNLGLTSMFDYFKLRMQACIISLTTIVICISYLSN